MQKSTLEVRALFTISFLFTACFGIAVLQFYWIKPKSSVKQIRFYFETLRIPSEPLNLFLKSIVKHAKLLTTKYEKILLLRMPFLLSLHTS